MRKVQWGARFEYEFLPNYKLLQKGFLSAGVGKRLEVERLMKGRYQDNLEVCQFLMSYFQREFVCSRKDPESYDPVARRRLSGCLSYPDWAPTPTVPLVRPRRRPKPVPVLPSTRASSVDLASSSTTPGLAPQKALYLAERERDFYLAKLEKIERVCKSAGGSQVDSTQLLELMYSVSDIEEFVRDGSDAVN